MSDRWIADRALGIEMSGVRKVFELARSLKDPSTSASASRTSVPEPVRAAATAPSTPAITATPSPRASPNCAEDQGVARPRLRPRRSRSAPDQRHERRPCCWRLAGDRQSRRRGHPLRPLLRHLPGHGDAGRRHAGLHRHLSGLRHRRGPASPPRSRRGPRRSCSTRPANPTGVVPSARRSATWPGSRPAAASCSSATRSTGAFCYDDPFAEPGGS